MNYLDNMLPWNVRNHVLIKLPRQLMFKNLHKKLEVVQRKGMFRQKDVWEISCQLMMKQTVAMVFRTLLYEDI